MSLPTLANENALAIKVWLELYLDAVRAAGQLMSKYEEIDRTERRPLFNLMVRALLEETPEIAATSTIRKPNALLDGLDAEFVNIPRNRPCRQVYPLLVLSLPGDRTGAAGKLRNLRTRELLPYPETNRGRDTLDEPYEYEAGDQKILI